MTNEIRTKCSETQRRVFPKNFRHVPIQPSILETGLSRDPMVGRNETTSHKVRSVRHLTYGGRVDSVLHLPNSHGMPKFCSCSKSKTRPWDTRSSTLTTTKTICTQWFRAPSSTLHRLQTYPNRIALPRIGIHNCSGIMNKFSMQSILWNKKCSLATSTSLLVPRKEYQR